MTETPKMQPAAADTIMLITRLKDCPLDIITSVGQLYVFTPAQPSVKRISIFLADFSYTSAATDENSDNKTDEKRCDGHLNFIDETHSEKLFESKQYSDFRMTRERQ